MKEKLYQSFSDLISDLTQREKDIFMKRFDLVDKKYSLQAIGDQYNLTRERIRQIQNEILNKINPKISNNQFFNKEFIELIKNHLGNLKIKRLSYLVFKFQNIFSLDDKEIKILIFLIKINPHLYFYNEDQTYYNFIYLNKTDLQQLNIFTKHLLSFLKKREIIKEDELLNLLTREIKNHFNVDLDIDEVFEFIKLFKIIAKNPFNEFSHIQNPRIAPNSLFEKIKLILEYENKPLSFYQIYQKLNELREIENELIHSSWQKIYSLKSVHSILNFNKKDFVLVGKGIYALKKWGIEEGQIIEIMRKIIEKNNGIMINDLYHQLSQLRIFSKNTFYVYLYKNFKVIEKKVYLK